MKAVTKYDVMKCKIIYELKKLKNEGLLEQFVEHYKNKRKELKKLTNNK